MTASQPDPSPKALPQTPVQSDRTAIAAAKRRAREAEALRENLRRRKQQARARVEPPTPESEGA